MFFLSVYQMVTLQDSVDALLIKAAEEHRNLSDEDKKKIDQLSYLKIRIREEVFRKDEASGKYLYELAQHKVTADFLDKLGCEFAPTQSQ